MMNRMIRIFVSSTFRNFEDERNALAAEVFPKLEKYCNAHGFSFQVIDLRWGVSHEAVAENRSAQICFDEIVRCQKMSPHLNFLVMAGERYGWKPLPSSIDADKWKLLTSSLEPDDPLWALLHDYYQVDHNHLHNSDYLLKAHSTTSDNRLENDERLRLRLNDLAQKSLPLEHRNDFNLSATELEIGLGYLHVPDEKFRKHTFIMLKKSGAPDMEPEAEDAAAQAEKLLKTLKDSTASTDQFCEYEAGDRNYLRAAERFLFDTIVEQIRQAPPLDSVQLERETLESAYREIQAQYFPLPQHAYAKKRIEDSLGQCVLLTGASGTGKSFFLKHFAADMNASGNGRAVAVFTDILPRCRSLGDALASLAMELARLGRLPDGVAEHFNARHPVRWFERQLQSLKGDGRVFLIIDTLEEVDSQSDESILQIRLPPQVTLIASIPDTSAMRTSVDLEPRRPVECRLEPLERATALELLERLLRARGRCLQPEQHTAVAGRLTSAPGELTPLYVELLAQKTGRLHSWDTPKLPHVLTFQTLLREVLLLESMDEYKTFRLHALGFLALSAAGLSESELLSLLSWDPDVVQEIRSQTEWDFPVFSPKTEEVSVASNYRGKIPVVLWAMLYAEIHPLLMEFAVSGIQLFQLRHSLLKREFLSILETDGQDRKLLKIMRSFFEQSSWYITDKDSFTGNRRKVTELLPIYEQLNAQDALHRCLEDLSCADAYIRCKEPHRILDYYIRYASSALEFQVLDLLQRKDLLYRVWPDSFLTSALAELPDIDNSFRAGRSRRLIRNSSGFSEEGTFFPQLREECAFALHESGIVAAYQSGLIHLIDLNRKISTSVFCVAPDEACFLYWDRDYLIVRYEKRRIAYVYLDGRLTERENTVCRNWGDLLSDSLEKIDRAGGIREKEAFTSQPMGNTVQYFRNGELERASLFYEDEKSGEAPELMLRLHGVLCAVIVNAAELEIIDLSQETVLYRGRFSVITHAEWSSDGKNLLIVLRGNSLLQIAVATGISLGCMRQPTRDYRQEQIHMAKNWLRNVGRTVLDFSTQRSDAIDRKGTAASTAPLYCAISVRHRFIACYYRIHTQSTLCLYSLDNYQRLSKPMVTDAITEEDAKEIPLYAARDRNGVVLHANGKAMLLDMERKKVIPAPPSAMRRQPQAGSVEEILKVAYQNDLDAGTRPFHREKTVEKKSVVFPLFFGKKSAQREQGGLYSEHMEILCSGEIYWVVDHLNGIISAYNSAYDCLGRDMPGRISAADCVDDILYLLAESTEQIITYRLE